MARSFTAHHPSANVEVHAPSTWTKAERSVWVARTGRQTSDLRVAVIAAAYGGGGDQTAERVSAWANAFDTGIDDRSAAEQVPLDLLDGVDVVYFSGGNAARAYNAVWATPLADAHGGAVLVTPDGEIREVHRGVTSSVVWSEGVTHPITP